MLTRVGPLDMLPRCPPHPQLPKMLSSRVSPLDSAPPGAPGRGQRSIFRRFALALGGFVVLPPLLLAAFVLLVDPYYVFGSPSLPGMNAVRPFYELHVIAAKPYQVQRIKPSAVALGSSRVEVGLNPRHPGWVDRNVFNFGLPSASSYDVMLAFLHAQSVGRPLKQAVVGLDFFAFNIFFPRNQEEQEARFAGNGSEAFADFLAIELASRPHGDSVANPDARSSEPGRTQRDESATTRADDLALKPAARRQPDAEPAEAEPPNPDAWSEPIYLALHPDVGAAVARGEFKSGREHYELAGRAERRETGMAPANWSDTLYLKLNPDVAAEVKRGTFLSGYHHYLANGRAEARKSGLVPSGWNEALYLRLHSDVAAEVERGTFLNGYHHYLVAGRAEGRVSGRIPGDWNEAQYLKIYPDVAAELRRGAFLSGYHHYLAMGRNEGREDGTPPDGWSDALYLKLYPDVAAEVKRGAFLSGYHHYLVAGRAEGRESGIVPSDWNETQYLKMYPDVAAEVRRGAFLSGYHHYLVMGRSEGREDGTPPHGWSDTLYLKLYPDVAAEVERGTFLSGYHHYLVAGRVERRTSAQIPINWNESLYLKLYPDAAAEVKRGTFQSGYHHFLAVGRTQGRESGLVPGDWNEARYLKLYPDVAVQVRAGNFLSGYHHYLANGRTEGRGDGTPPKGWNDDLYLKVYPDVAAAVQRGEFLSGYHHYLAAGRVEGRASAVTPGNWNEALYLRINPDVQREVASGMFLNGYHHYLVNGRDEHREGGMIPRDWDEAGYLQINPDVQYHITQGFFLSGYHHYVVAGRAENRATGTPPPDWNEAAYLAANPAARTRIALGDYRSGYVHYAAVGRNQGLLGGSPPGDPIERLRQRWPELNRAAFQVSERFRLIFSTTAVRDSVLTVLRQSEQPSFDDRGMRMWTEEETTRRSGGIGSLFRAHLVNWRWYLWLMPPRYMYCFTNPETGMSAFDAYRFMLRRAYLEGTDLRLYVTPLNAAVRRLIVALGLGERYEFWLKELVRINEEEAVRAHREPFSLWDFSAPNTITREPIPLASDLSPMRWFWDFSHFREAAGDLILDRVFGHSHLSRPLPVDFGVRLTGENLDAHVGQSKAALDDWSASNSDFVSQMVASVQGPKAQTRQAQATCW
jgi:hypothetical protein